MCKKDILGGHRGEPRLKELGTVQFGWNCKVEEDFAMLTGAIWMAPTLSLP